MPNPDSSNGAAPNTGTSRVLAPHPHQHVKLRGVFREADDFHDSSGDVERYKGLANHRSARYRSLKDVTVKHDLDNLSVFFQWP